MNKNSERRKSTEKIFFLVLALIIFSQAIWWILDPGSRVGFFGIGLPADMTEFHSTITKFKISYPETWVAHNLSQGNHGDIDIVAKIQVPGRSWPSLTISAIRSMSITTEKLADLERKKEEQKPLYSVISLDEESTFDKTFLVRRYKWIGHSALFGDYFIECKSYFYVKSSLGYTLDFCAKESQWPEVRGVFNRMIESFAAE